MNARLYFGRIPEKYYYNIDGFFSHILIRENYNMQAAVDRLVDSLDSVGGYNHTVNPLIVNYISDEIARELIWFIDSEGNEIKMGDDVSMCKKLQFMGPGEALADDSRVLG